MTNNDLSIKVTFDLTTGYIDIQDTTDYAGQGITPTDVDGFLKVEYNTGSGNLAAYNNLAGPTPDIVPPVYTNATPISYPVDSDGNVLPASYTVTYKIIVDDGVTEQEFVNTFSYEYNFTAPEICITGEVNCLTSTIKSTDVTEYDSPTNATQQSLSRTHTLYPPPTSGLSPTSNSLTVLTVSPVYTTTWTSEIVSDLVYLHDNGFYINLQLSGTKEIQVVCDTNLSKILCCINQIDKTYNNYLCKNPVKATNYAENVVIPTWRYLVLYLAAITAGNATKAASAYANILEYSQCEDCGCDDEVSLVTPVNGGGATQTYSVTSPDNSVEVVTVVVGSNTEFQLQVSATIQNIINNLGNAIDVVSGDSYITVTPSGSNPKTFTITYTGPTIHTQQLVQKQLAISLGGGIDYLDCIVTEINNVGPDVAPLPHTVFIGGTPFGNSSTDTPIITVSGFLAAGSAKAYIANASVMRFTKTLIPTTIMTPFKLETFWCEPNSTTGEIYFRFVDNTGLMVPSLADLIAMSSYETIYVSIDIIIEP